MKKVLSYVVFSLVVLVVFYVGGLALMGVNVFEKEETLVLEEASKAGTLLNGDVRYYLLRVKVVDDTSEDGRQLLIPDDWYSAQQIDDYTIEIKYGDGKIMTVVENKQIIDFKIMVCYRIEDEGA